MIVGFYDSFRYDIAVLIARPSSYRLQLDRDKNHVKNLFQLGYCRKISDCIDAILVLNRLQQQPSSTNFGRNGRLQLQDWTG